ncbi:2-hydroxy-3-oxopropionate reductase [Thalassoporum mexicanum PCC 7367]|uniref:NAD(P)-dependent oxidoreductase n=1 Tax=Thalassoporum mexicanum TaxID=3457544 RepID=UPI00029FB7D4|nr:NAD(P)-dependent oxidoreductase [Pseudanabaena sp. PCC 7367]AFY68569.1 2-hydroxy-3-oxopropionate reductase [Pseudanabaena sp. PCC 7367]
MTTQKVAFLGLGVMGAPMTINLAKAGYAVTAWNRTADRPHISEVEAAGAIIAPSIEAAIADADVIFLCLGDAPDVEAVVLGDGGVAEFAKSEAMIVDTSTIGVSAAKKIATELQKHNLRFLDAPISGGDIGAQKGTLTIMVGGSEADFEACMPLFSVLGKSIHWCGPSGSGQGVKLCNQVLVSLNMVGICEAMLLAEKLDIDPQLVVDVCGSGAAGSWALTNLGMKVAEADFQPGFMIKHMLKDLRLVLEAYHQAAQVLYQVPDETFGEGMPGVELADQLFKDVRDLEDGDRQGTQAMIRAYREFLQKAIDLPPL